MKWLVTGAGGQVGAELVALLQRRGESVYGADHSQLDITDAAAVDRLLRERAPDVVVNCAAYTAVDAAEADEARAASLNGDAPKTMARSAKAVGARLLQLSTDYVFDGRASTPYDEATPVRPVSAYGRTKAAGEAAVLQELPETGYIVRTAWVYGRHGTNFVRTMLRLAAERDTVDVVDDQIGQPTWAGDLADGLFRLGQTAPAPGIYHCTNQGQTSWFGFARAVFAGAGLDPDRVKPTSSDRFVRPAPRPAYSVLGDRRWREAGLDPMAPWQDALQRSSVASWAGATA